MATGIPIRILLIEDSDDDAQLLIRTIRKGGFDPETLRVETPADLAAAMQEHWEIVLSDYTMPKLDGGEALSIVREYDPDIPFFYVSGTLGEDRAVEAMRAGAQNYFIKGNLKRMVPAMERELAESVRRREYRLAEERIHYLANYDVLTDLPNRILFAELCAKAAADALQTATGVCVFYLDLDNFKSVNDQLGTVAGDALLIELGQRLSNVIPSEGVVSRLSADEFGILIPGITTDAEATAVADKVLEVVNLPFSLARYEWRINASMGGSVFPRDSGNDEAWQAGAIMALHHAQKMPGNSFLLYTRRMRDLLQEKLQMNVALEQALERAEFRLLYQPQVQTIDGEIAGAEALIRWQRPDNRMVGPDTFIPMTEESGLIVPIGDWVLRQACMEARRWRQQKVRPTRIAVNFSAYQFLQRNLVRTVADRLQEYELTPECLEIEITETTLMHDADAVESILSGLHEQGIRIALDDFGTGYSSLSHLKRFPVDILKIDKSFITGLPDDLGNLAIVNAIIAMAEQLGMQVVAEGVETAEQYDCLKEAGCNIVQGYFIQRPAPADDILSMLQRGHF